jgi:[acyl-carrier-protein] S-malonyltransferase
VAKENKIKAIPLSVSTAFHSPMMEPAVEPLRQILLKSDLKAPTLKIYSNVTGDDMFGTGTASIFGNNPAPLFDNNAAPFSGDNADSLSGNNPAPSAGEEITEYVSKVMAKQANSPIYWQETIENMARDGIEVFIEIGPGTTLSGLVNKILPETTTLNIEDEESLKNTMQALSSLQTEGEKI